MRVLVTGAGGFLGQYVVAAAIQRGHHVRALVRPASRNVPEAWLGHPQIEVVRGDMRSRQQCPALLREIDVVIHLAATKAGDLFEQFAGTVAVTENLLAAMDEAGVKRIVMTSSFAVYEYLRRWSWSRLDESSPLAQRPDERDAYCQTKLLQETLVREVAAERNWQAVILRPGVIFGRDNLWSARLGMQVNSRYWIRIGALATIPLTYVENCADAIVLGVEYDGPDRDLVVNIVDSDLPSARAYVKALKQQSTPRPWVIPLPLLVLRGLARLASLTNRVLFGGQGKVPGLLTPASLHARCKPLRFSNEKAMSALGWQPRFSWREGLERSFNGVSMSQVPEPRFDEQRQPVALEQPA
jgi:nucleoside-diphosphate-sugar epimerase